MRNLHKDVSLLDGSHPIQQNHDSAIPVFEGDLANPGIRVGECDVSSGVNMHSPSILIENGW
jgi:hypothetical protein